MIAAVFLLDMYCNIDSFRKSLVEAGRL